MRIYPWPLPFEGFFVARLRKTGPLPIRPVNEAISWQESRRSSDPEISPLLTHLEQLWGVPASFLAGYRFLRTRHRLWIIAPEWECLPQRAFMMAGLPLADQKSAFWRLTTPAVQWLNGGVTQWQISFSEPELSELFREGRLPASRGPLRYHVLHTGGRNLAVVAQADGFYRIHLPHRFELVI